MEYTLVGVVQLFSEETCLRMGYKKGFSENVSLCYSKDGKLDEGLLFREDGNSFRYIPSHLIYKRISLIEGKENYPELFL